MFLFIEGLMLMFVLILLKSDRFGMEIWLKILRILSRVMLKSDRFGMEIYFRKKLHIQRQPFHR